MLDGTFFRTIGAIVRDRYRDHIFRKAKDVYGKKFSTTYSKGYAKRKKAGGVGFESGFPYNSPVKSGDLYRNYSLIKISTDGFQIGWTSLGARVEHLEKNKRVLTAPNQPLPKSVETYLSTEAHKYIKKKLGPNKTTIHKIGKK